MAITVGPKNGITFTSVEGIPAGIAWTSPSNAQISDDVYATSSPTNAKPYTQFLKATNFLFSISGLSIINGIQVDIEKKHDGSFGEIMDSSVRIIKGGAMVGTDYAEGGISWGTSDAYTTYGGSSDLWGLTWTAADINASDFGTAIQAFNDLQTNGITASIDNIRITVFYTESGMHRMMMSAI